MYEREGELCLCQLYIYIERALQENMLFKIKSQTNTYILLHGNPSNHLKDYPQIIILSGGCNSFHARHDGGCVYVFHPRIYRCNSSSARRS